MDWRDSSERWSKSLEKGETKFLSVSFSNAVNRHQWEKNKGAGPASKEGNADGEGKFGSTSKRRGSAVMVEGGFQNKRQ